MAKHLKIKINWFYDFASTLNESQIERGGITTFNLTTSNFYYLNIIGVVETNDYETIQQSQLIIERTIITSSMIYRKFIILVCGLFSYNVFSIYIYKGMFIGLLVPFDRKNFFLWRWRYMSGLSRIFSFYSIIWGSPPRFIHENLCEIENSPYWKGFSASENCSGKWELNFFWG